jgi:hypothetical protein
MAMKGLSVGYMSVDVVTGNVGHLHGAFGLHSKANGKLLEVSRIS